MFVILKGVLTYQSQPWSCLLAQIHQDLIPLDQMAWDVELSGILMNCVQGPYDSDYNQPFVVQRFRENHVPEVHREKAFASYLELM